MNSYLGEKLDASINDFETNLENARIEPQQIESFAHTIGNGPTKPLPGRINLSALDDLDMPHNIALDEHQRRAIVENQPLLIDGLAGTGKLQCFLEGLLSVQDMQNRIPRFLCCLQTTELSSVSYKMYPI